MSQDNVTKLPNRWITAFTKHEIVSFTHTSWVLKAKHADGLWDGNMWMEVVGLHGGKLLVHGDFDPVVFSYYSSRGKASAEALVHWMGNRGIFYPDGYFMEKASIGMGGRDKVTTWDEAKARRDILEYADYLDEDSEDEYEEYKEAIEALRELASGYMETEHDMWVGLSDIHIDELYDNNFGLSPSTSVYAAWGVLNHLSKLLFAEKKTGT